MISVIVPVYNCGELLQRCVHSLREQTYKDLQIIIVDDGSSDGTPAICDALAAEDSRITVLHRPNGGVSSARNAGLAAAEGKYVAFADADDYVNPDHMMNLYDVMQRHGCDVAISSYLTESEDKCSPPVSRLSGSGNDGEKSANGYKEVCYGHDSAVCELLAGGAVGGFVWNKLYRRELLAGAAFRGDVKILEDLLFNFGVFQKVRTAVFSDYPSYHYIQRGQSAMHRGFGEEHRQMVRTAREVCGALAGESSELADAGKGLLSTTILWVVDVMAEYGPYDKALVREYRKEFRPLRRTYLRLRRVPLQYRASAIFFSMGYPVFKIAVNAVRKLKG